MSPTSFLPLPLTLTLSWLHHLELLLKPSLSTAPFQFQHKFLLNSIPLPFFCLLLLLLSHFSHVQLFATLWIIAPQPPLSMGFSRQEYWSGLSCPPPGDLPKPEIKPRSPALAGGFLPSSATFPFLSPLIPWQPPCFSLLPRVADFIFYI